MQDSHYFQNCVEKLQNNGLWRGENKVFVVILYNPNFVEKIMQIVVLYSEISNQVKSKLSFLLSQHNLEQFKEYSWKCQRYSQQANYLINTFPPKELTQAVIMNACCFSKINWIKFYHNLFPAQNNFPVAWQNNLNCSIAMNFYQAVFSIPSAHPLMKM